MLVFTLLSCEKKTTDNQFEQNDLNEIFLKVVDSIYVDYRSYTSISEMGKHMCNKSGKWIGRNLVGQPKRDIAKSSKKYPQG